MPTTSSRPKKIIILGGGTAGWMAASLLNKAWPSQQTEIQLIESAEIGKIGVGEGSTPALRLFFQHLGVAESQWMPECHATYKCGISFPNWSTKENFNQYTHPFYSQADWKTGNAFIHNANLRRQGFNVPAHPDSFWLQSKLVQQDKSPIASEKLAEEMDYGYHFDAYLLGNFLKKRAINLGIKHLQDTVKEVEINNDGSISQLITAKNGALTADIFIDCSGFAALLISKTLKVPFTSYKDSLFNDSAIAIQSHLDPNEPIPSQTRSSALSCGWAWQIPLSSRFGNGYVYSSNYIDDQAAEVELRQHLGKSCHDFDARILKFKLGRVEQHWHKNVLAVGLSQGFIEPLEATALMVIQHTVERFIQDYEQNQLINNIDKQQKFNHYINNLFDKIKDYIVAHYKLNSRHDSLYWIDNRENTNISDTLASLLATWDQTEGDFEAALKEHQSELVYFSPSWYCLLAGKGRFPEQLSPTPSNIKVAPEQEIIKFCQTISQYFLSHQEQLSKLYGAKWPKS